MKILFIILIFLHRLFAFSIDKDRAFDNILPLTQVYIDQNNSLSLQEVQSKAFETNTKEQLGFGYSPKFSVWIKITLDNPSSKPVTKVLEYANPLTSYVTFYDGKRTIEDGLLQMQEERTSLNPAFRVSIEPHSSKVIYIKAHSHITTLIVKLHLWSPKSFYAKEIKHQVILALFFGAMGIIIVYNFLIYLGTREISYLYYVLFFIGIILHHLLYKGMGTLYLLSPTAMANVIEYSTFIVATPALFLALFIQNMLKLHQYPRLNRFLNTYLIFFPMIIVFFHWQEWHTYRNVFSVVLLFILLFMTIYALLKRDKQAYILALGWLLFVTSGAFMYLSSLGIFDIFTYLPYYTEFALIAESLIFSLLLANKIKQLAKEKITLQANLINHQKQEQTKLFNMVQTKTQELQNSLHEKELMLKEFNHRLKNSIATIVSFLRLQIDELEEPQTQAILINLENRIMSISHLYTLLYPSNAMSQVNAYEYFRLLIDDIEQSHDMPLIDLTLDTSAYIEAQEAIYCGFILNEAITNALQHAFDRHQKGKIAIKLTHTDTLYQLSIEDNGKGYVQGTPTQSLGLEIIQTLVKTQLHGALHINATHGVKMQIEWKNKQKLQ